MKNFFSLIILIRIQGGANPRPVCQASDRRSVGGHLGQSGFSLQNRAFEGIEDAIREMVPAEDVPEQFHRVQFRRIRGQIDQMHPLRKVQPLGFVGRGAVRDHNQEIVRMGLPDLVQKTVHAFRIYLFCRHEVERPILGAYSGIFIHVFPHQGQRNNRTERSRRSTGPGIGHPSKTSLVLKKKTDRTVLRSCQDGGRQSFRE